MHKHESARLLVCLASLLLGCQGGANPENPEGRSAVPSADDQSLYTDQSSDLVLVTLVVPNMT
ncbi:MAG: hypothetical protein MK171_02060 [Pirellulales bacterium]|nr:hypothetical protein [Pirellulales bacterium]